MNAVVHLPLASRPSEAVREATLGECVGNAVRRYLDDLGDSQCDDLYALFLGELEMPLLREVMRWSGNNQSRAAQALGLSRATLRKKLQTHGLI